MEALQVLLVDQAITQVAEAQVQALVDTLNQLVLLGQQIQVHQLVDLRLVDQITIQAAVLVQVQALVDTHSQLVQQILQLHVGQTIIQAAQLVQAKVDTLNQLVQQILVGQTIIQIQVQILVDILNRILLVDHVIIRLFARTTEVRLIITHTDTRQFVT